MSRLDDTISDVAYILDTLMAYRNIANSGDCNRCEKKKACEYVPKPGQLVRYNCPFYKKMEDEYDETRSNLLFRSSKKDFIR